MTHPETAELLAFLGSAYPTIAVTPGMVDAWSLALEPAPYKTCKAAALAHLQTSKWPPTIADLAGIMASYAARVPDPETILRDILHAVVHESRQPTNLHPVTLAVIDAIGWNHLCDSENPEALRAHVLRIAATYRKRALEAATLSAAGLALPVECQPHQLPGREPSHVSGLLPGAMS